MEERTKKIYSNVVLFMMTLPFLTFAQGTNNNEIIGTLVMPGALRDCASKNCKIIRYYAETSKIKIVGIDDNNEWYETITKDDYDNDLNGWMHYSLFVQDYRNNFSEIKPVPTEKITNQNENLFKVNEFKVDDSKVNEFKVDDFKVNLTVGIVFLICIFLFKKNIKIVSQYLKKSIDLIENGIKKFVKNGSFLIIQKKYFGLKFKPKKSAIALLVGFIILIIIMGISYEYTKTSKLLNEAEKLTNEERYNEANEKLELAQIKLIVNSLGIKKQEISKKIDENKKLEEDKLRYNQGLSNLNNNNLQEAINILSGFSENSFYYQKAQTKIEESKRIIVEGKLSVETIAKLAAETKAKQEEFEKGIKEQQLAGKEAAEKMMNADNDGDGLNYGRELELKTSDWDTDSDNDGIIDNEDLHPAGGDRPIAQHFEWIYRGQKWTWDYSFPSDWYDYYKNKIRAPQGISYVTSNDKYIKQIAEMLKEKATENGYTKSEFAASFIQSLGYVSDSLISYNDYPKYPLETLAEQNGDCEDSSYLSAAIINAMGIDCGLVLLPGHMAIAIAYSNLSSGYYYSASNGRNYYYIETTGKNWTAGQIPNDYKYVQAKILTIPFGEYNIYPQYKKPCEASPDFLGYYYNKDNEYYYLDSQCNNSVSCLPYRDLYVDYKTKVFYWDNGCSQEVMPGCSKSSIKPGYFFNGSYWYYDYQCIQKAKI
ncbi:MAG: hypothetical protein WC319_02250 [Candidatus Paceibacterota bacterium]|jgi:hypothetical protein